MNRVVRARWSTHAPAAVVFLAALSVTHGLQAQGEQVEPAPPPAAPPADPAPPTVPAPEAPPPEVGPATGTADEADAPNAAVETESPTTSTEAADAEQEAAASAAVGAEGEAAAELETDAEELSPVEAAEVDALAAELLVDESLEEVDEYAINIYGFVDALYSYNIKDYGFFNPYSSFAIGRLNVYTAAELGDNWRTLFETRFTYLPHGSVPATGDGTPVPRTSTIVTDYIDLDRPIRWGGVVIERAWLEKTYESWLNIRIGHWLTPYGIWNVDHGSPVILGVRRPYIVGELLFPESQTGLQLYGSYGFGPTVLGYHLTVSNGRGPVDVYRDFDSNKALGGRLYATHDFEEIGQATLGVSGYTGSYTDREEQFVIDPDGSARIDRPIVTESYETSLAADLKWTWGGFLLQSEGIVRETTFEDETRPFIPVGFSPAAGFVPDFRSLGMYAMTGYRFEWLGVMPWVGWEYYDSGSAFRGKSAAFWGGLNFRPTPRVVLKAQYTYSYFPGDDPVFADIHFNNLDFQAAWSF